MRRARDDFTRAEDQLFAKYSLPLERRRLALRDPALSVGVVETGEGAPVLFVHGSGMSGATWAPMLAHLRDRRVFAVDLPGFGASDPCDYRGRSLREHAVAQVTSMLDVLGLERAPLVGTSLGAMWSLCAAVDAAERVESVVVFGMPAVSLPGLLRDPFFGAFTTPGLGRLMKHMPPPRSAKAMRKAGARAFGARATERMPDEFYELCRQIVAQPAWGNAMWTHLNLAMRMGKARPENALTADDLRSLTIPVRFVWGDDDVYGHPDVAADALGLIGDVEMHVVEGGHAPFLDEPERSAAVVRAVTS